MFKIVSLLVVLGVFTQIHASSLNQFIRLTQQGNANLDELSKLSEMIRGNRGDIEVSQDIEERQAAAPPAAAVAATTPAAAPGLSGLLSGILSAFGSTLTPFLGPFKPLADAFGPLLNSAFTNIFSNALKGIVGVLRSNDLPNSGYDTYLVNIPDQGSYIILARTPTNEKTISPAPAPAPVQPSQPTIAELISNAIRQSELKQQGNTKSPLNAAAGGSVPGKKPVVIPFSLFSALAGAAKAKNLNSHSDYEILIDENN